MRTSPAAALLLLGACTPASYYYNFDITDPGAHNLTRPGERDVLEDADVKLEVLVDATSFQSILLVVTNKTSQPLTVGWNQVSIIGPDRVEKPLHPDEGLGHVEPGTRARARLIPFELPDLGNAATAYDNQAFELVVPMVVRGTAADRRVHLTAHVTKLP